MKAIHFILLSTGILLSACSVFENEQEEQSIFVVTDGEEIVIRNSLQYDVHYFVASESVLSVIFWVPTVTEENALKAGNVLRFNKIDFYKDGIPEPIIFHYWDEDWGEDNSKIFTIVIE